MARIEVLPPSETLGIVDTREILERSGAAPPEVHPETGAPLTLRAFVVRADPLVKVVPHFLSEDECRHLRALADGSWTRSLVGLKDEAATSGDYGPPSVNGILPAVKQTRTSSSCMLRPAQTSVVERVEHRLAALAGLPVEQLERLVIVRYAPGEQFSEHHDGKFRPRTVFVYLNDLPEGDGGDTYFPHLGLSFVPRMGSAVMWPNAQPDGKEDSRMVHAGRPPVSGIKYGVNCFFNDTVVRIIDYPAVEVTLEDAFVVDFATLGRGGAPVEEDTIRTFSFDTEPGVTGVPGLASVPEVEHLLSLSGNGGDGGAADGGGGAFQPPVRRLRRDLEVLAKGQTDIVASLEARIAAAARFPTDHLAPLRVARCFTRPGEANRGCGQRAGFLCLAEKDDVFFPHLGLRCLLRRGDLLLWPNAIRAETVASDGYGGDGASGSGRQRVVEDLRTRRVHVALQDGAAFGLDISFSDAPIRTPGS